MADVSPAFRRGSVPAAIDTRFLDHLPSAVLLCDPASLVIRYANRRSLRLLEALRAMLPVPPEEMVGSSLSVVHPAFHDVLQQLQESGDEARKLVLTGQGERLEFHAHALRDPNGRPGFVQVTWSITTAVAAQEDEAHRLRQMVEQMPLSVVTCRRPDFRIDYANAAARVAYEGLKRFLPDAPDQIVGAPVDIFFPARRLDSLDGLPFAVNVPAGDRVITLCASALRDARGQYLAPLLTFETRAAPSTGLSPDLIARLGDGTTVIKTDEVLESLKASIGRIRTVAETIERISARTRLPAQSPVAQTLPAEAAVTQPASESRHAEEATVKGSPDATNGAILALPEREAPDAPLGSQAPASDLSDAAPPSLVPSVAEASIPVAAPPLNYAERLSRRMGRLLRGGR